MARRAGKTKAQWLADEVAAAVNAGKAISLETVDFSDPNRPKTCLEVDFPILPVNQVAAIEGNAGKPIYQVSKWWARRRSSVFRSMLIAAAARAPDDPAEAAKLVWDAYYGNHDKKGAFSRLKVADVFMGGGTTVVEGCRLGMEMYGTDLNPVAWLVVKNALADIKSSEVEALLADVEAEVRPQIMPFYACDCPRGHKGTWRQISTQEVMGDDFDPLALAPEVRCDYAYHGPEVIYAFWAKHGPCQVTGCGHRTPIMSKPLVAVKKLTVKTWPHRCGSCKQAFDVEEQDARMAPDVPLIVADSEAAHTFLLPDLSVECPHCGHCGQFSLRRKPIGKKIDLSLLIHPRWLAGEASKSEDGLPYGGSVSDDAESTVRWNVARQATMGLLEVRGRLLDEVVCPETGQLVKTGKTGGTVPQRSKFACGACGTVQDVLTAVKASGKSGPVAVYAVHGYCPTCDQEKRPYRGRFFATVSDTRPFDTAAREWEVRKENDLAPFWPRQEVPYGFMTGVANGDIRKGHGFTHWWTMFNARQMLVHSQLLRAIVASETTTLPYEVREYVLGAFQQYLRNQNMFCFWDISRDCLAPHMSNANYHPKSNVVENSVFAHLGRGNWDSCAKKLLKGMKWSETPWEVVSNDRLRHLAPALAEHLTGKSEKVFPSDPVCSRATLECVSATDLSSIDDGVYDLVVTDPPFGGLLHYSELADFFHVWLRLALQDRYPDLFSAEYTPKTLEAVANRARHPENPDVFYQRILTECWREAHRILKPGGLLAFTFHHSEDAPWVAVLESLFDAGFYLEATYPIRSDETKGAGEFGSKKIEYDIIHVCRKQREEPKPVSWAKMRRQMIFDVRQLQTLLELHQREGLPEADLQVIRRGKALEYFSRHYGKVYVDVDKAISVQEALLGINQLLDEEIGGVVDPPPASAEPFTRQFLRMFDGLTSLPRDQVQKYLRGTGSSPGDFEDRGWCRNEERIYHLVSPLEIARGWVGRHRRGMVSDYDQTAFLIGACFDNSGINVTSTLSNSNFTPHPALSPLLDWFSRRGGTTEIRNAAIRGRSILQGWNARNQEQARQLELFLDEEAAS